MHVKIGRNDPCWCGSMKKYKNCHQSFDEKIEELRSQGHIVPDHSLIKTPEQIAGIKESAKINIAVLDEVASKIKEGMTTEEIDKIVNTFQNKEAVDDFSVTVTYDEIKEKGYSLSAGQYFDIKIDYVDITEEEFNKRMNDYRTTLAQQFTESHRLEDEIMKQLNSLSFNGNVGKE